MQGYRLCDLVMAAFVTILLLSNVLARATGSAGELYPLSAFWPFQGGHHSFFPRLLCAGGRADRSLWLCPRAALHLGEALPRCCSMAAMSAVVVALPPAPTWEGQAAYEAVFGQVPRIVFASSSPPSGQASSPAPMCWRG